jgi:hypothetical protein
LQFFILPSARGSVASAVLKSEENLLMPNDNTVSDDAATLPCMEIQKSQTFTIMQSK